MMMVSERKRNNGGERERTEGGERKKTEERGKRNMKLWLCDTEEQGGGTRSRGGGHRKSERGTLVAGDLR